MADERPTRWQKATADWAGFELRDLSVGVVGLVLGVVVLALLGFPGATVVEVVVVATAGIAAAVLYALGQLLWAWLQAPMRLLTADVIAIRERVEAAAAAHGQSKPKIDVRLTLMNHKRVGDELSAELSPYQSEVVAQGWTDSTLEFLSEHCAPADVERFLDAGSGTARRRMAARLAMLGELIERLGSERQG